jgi:glyceraldehyde 3-phosphate dehydrogenase
MAVKVGINGFGRIGRFLLRLAAFDPQIEIVGINARADNEKLALLAKYDSSHGKFAGTLDYDDDGLIVEGQKVKVTRDHQGEWKWKELGAEVVVETTGSLKKAGDLKKHIECGARKVVVSSPAPGADFTVVMGVNHEQYDPKQHTIISNSSCTTNCLAPACKIVHETFGIRQGVMTTVHSYTMDQRLLDGSHRDPRRARSAAMSMIPTSTGAAGAVGKVLPELAGRLNGLAIRVPTPNVSIADFVCHLEKDSSVKEVNAALKAASEGALKDILGYSEEPLVSVDYTSREEGGVVDALSTMVTGDRLLKLIIWYDNESGYSAQLLRFIKYMETTL